jgi:hypothetical protein
MSGAFGLAGFYFGRKPTSATSQADVSVAESSMPWQVDHDDHDDHSKHFKYQYHPKGDRSQSPKNAPSALNTVVIPNVTLPKVRTTAESVQHVCLTPRRSYTTCSTNGARMTTRRSRASWCFPYESKLRPGVLSEPELLYISPTEVLLPQFSSIAGHFIFHANSLGF